MVTPKALVLVLPMVFAVGACAAPNATNGMDNMMHSSLSAASSATPAPISSSPQATSPAELTSSNGTLDVTLTAAESMLPYDGKQRWAMTYNGSVNGPTLRVHPGDTLNVTLVNNLAKPTSLHTHGLHVSPDQDNPFVMVDPGQSRTYSYTIPADQQAGTYWYHPHVHELTAEQVASGLSGAIVVEDDTDVALAKVSSDNVLVITDPPLVTSNPWTAESGGMGMGGMNMTDGSSGVDMMTAMVGRSGPRLLTNGADGVQLKAAPGQLARAHVVNASASTTLTLQYSGRQLLALSATGGRLPAAREATSVVLAPGERTELVLVPGPDGGVLTAQRMSNEGDGGPIGEPELIAAVPADAGTDVGALPTSMSANTRDLFAADVKVSQRRMITLDGHMNPTIDGKPFDPNTVNFTAKKGTVEEWVIKNNTPMVHPIHLHTWPFQIEGQQGWNDVVEVPAKSSQVIRVAYDDFAGTTVLHCHILDHEDIGMMAVIRVE